MFRLVNFLTIEYYTLGGINIKKKERATVYDIAKLANVAQSTVSKVLNNYPNIRESTRAKVMEAAKELDYFPDMLARSLVTKKTYSIGLLVEDITNPFYSESAKYIFKRAKNLGYSVLIQEVAPDAVDLAVKELKQRNIDGVLIASIDKNSDLPMLEEFEDIPAIFYNQTIDYTQVNYVRLDDKMGGQEVVDHLYKLGHRNIGFISGPVNRSTYADRFKGYKQGLKAKNINYDEEIVYVGEMTYESIGRGIKKNIDKDNLPTAFFAASDALALDLISILTNLGYRIPTDISVVGFGDIQLSSHPLLRLTTISQRTKDMSTIALDKLISLIEEREHRDRCQIILEPKLIIRDTTARISL